MVFRAENAGLFAELPEQLAQMLEVLEVTAAKVGLSIRWSNCMWKEVVCPSRATTQRESD